MLFKVKLPVIAENCPACFEAPKVSTFAFVAFLFVFILNFCCISSFQERHRTKQLLAVAFRTTLDNFWHETELSGTVTLLQVLISVRGVFLFYSGYFTNITVDQIQFPKICFVLCKNSGKSLKHLDESKGGISYIP